MRAMMRSNLALSCGPHAPDSMIRSCYAPQMGLVGDSNHFVGANIAVVAVEGDSEFDCIPSASHAA